MASYYVDATLGDDSNPGTQSQPWKTISKVNSSSFNPGDKIYFKRGEVWREQLTVPSSGEEGNPITFGAYGSGDKPIISALEEVPSEDWSGPDENGEYTYSTTTTCVVFAEDGEFIPEGVAGNLSPGEWDYDSDTDTLYYKPSSGTPSDHTTERGERSRAVLIDGKSYITLVYLSLVGNNHPGAYKNCIDVLGTGSNIIIDSCLVKIAYVCGIVFGLDISNSRISNTEVAQCSSRGIWVRGSNSIIRNCHVHHIGQGNLIDSHDREGISVGGNGNIVESCIVHDCGHPSAGDDQSGWGILLYGGTGNNTVRYNTVYNIDHIGIGVFQSDDKVYYNVIHSCGIKATADEGYFGGIRVKGNLSGVEIYNNVVYKCHDNISTTNKHYGAGILVFAAANETLTLTLKNNVIAFNETNYDLVVQEMDATAEINLTSDYNCFYRPDGAKFYYNDSEKTFSEYQAASGQDSHSISLDPSFVDPDNGDFHLKVGSPCIDAGVDVGLDRDFDYNPVPWGAGVDIGAFELVRRITVLKLSHNPLDCRGKWIDLSRFGNHGIPHGGARPVQICPGVMGFEFDGHTYVNCGNNKNLDFLSDAGFSLMLWVLTRNQYYTYPSLINRGTQSATIGYFWLYTESDYDYKNIHFLMSDGQNQYVGTYANNVLERDRLVCVTLTFDPSGSTFNLYKNAICVKSYCHDILSVTSGDFYVGTYQGQTNNYAFNGIIAEVIFAKETWSPDEVRENIYRSPIYRILRGLPRSFVYVKVPFYRRKRCLI